MEGDLRRRSGNGRLLQQKTPTQRPKRRGSRTTARDSSRRNKEFEEQRKHGDRTNYLSPKLRQVTMADKYPDDPLDALNFSIDDEDLEFSPKKTLDKDRASSLFGVGDDPKKSESPAISATTDAGMFGGLPRKRGGSGDWLGLKDPSPLEILNDDLAKPQSAKIVTAPRETPIRAKTAEIPSSSDNFGKADATPKAPVRKRLNILDDLFGDSSFTKEKEKPRTPMFGTNIDTNSSTPNVVKKEPTTDEFSYLPSLNERRRVGEKKTPTTPKISDSSDWLLDNKDRNTKQTSEVTRELPKTNAVTPNLAKRTVQRDSGLPSWLSSGFNDRPLETPDPGDATTQPTKVVPPNNERPSMQPTVQKPEPIREAAHQQTINQAPVQQMVPLQMPNQQTSSHPQQPFYLPLAMPMTGEIDPSLIGQLTNMHAQIGAAMTKHHQNLQTYMQAILFEAQRVGLTEGAKISKDEAEANDGGESDGSNESKSETAEVKETKKIRKSKTKKDRKVETIKRQELEIQEMEIQISKLELQVAQLELKISNIEDVKTLEIESLKKTHGFEISSWESRSERAKENFEEIVKEYQEKIKNLKKKIEEMESQHKERIEALQTERMSDLEKLGEFHRIALDQAASITLPQLSGLGAVRLPMKIMQKPEDETELAERESALLEKEKHVEVLRQKLELERMQLDEVKERDKIKREEKEREIRRMTMETQLKEEMMTKEFERKKDQMDALQAQIEKMREEALKEQAELTREKLGLAAEKARMEAAMSLERTSESPQLQPLDMMKARAELEAALEAAKEAREAADRERRRHVELRKSVEETTWDQKDKEQQLAMRERHVSNMLKEAEAKRAEATAALDKAHTLNEEMETKQRDIKEHLKQIETKERVLSAERMEIAREKVELEKKKTQLEVLLPELNPAEDLVVHGVRPTSSHKDYIDPKALIMRLKAEKDLQHYITPLRSQSQKM
ncbi:hypothetical protein GE061_003777 [Apolygus lucorum]|uniref:Fas-binding factor 1 n=1 Tax=Apolygus lucorum TaxID=248454 RepID=A0A6A4JSI8_APOLU|nr:hypothetical protein GE061_003777 [Apolygus lucorum]